MNLISIMTLIIDLLIHRPQSFLTRGPRNNTTDIVRTGRHQRYVILFCICATSHSIDKSFYLLQRKLFYEYDKSDDEILKKETTGPNNVSLIYF